jgi:hypothetical protein
MKPNKETTFQSHVYAVKLEMLAANAKGDKKAYFRAASEMCEVLDKVK